MDDAALNRWAMRRLNSRRGKYGLSIKEIAHKFGCSRDDVRRAIDLAEQELEEKGELSKRGIPHA